MLIGALLEVLFKICNEHPHHYYREVPQGYTVFEKLLKGALCGRGGGLLVNVLD